MDAKAGEHANITCKASVRSYFDVVRIQAAYDHGTNLTISDGRDVKSPFSKLQRLEIKHGVENQNVFFTTLIFTGWDSRKSCGFEVTLYFNLSIRDKCCNF